MVFHVGALDRTEGRSAGCRPTCHEAQPNAPMWSRPYPVRVSRGAAEWEGVRALASGQRDDYALDPKPLAPRGGQGEVFGARHRPTGVRVAFKRLLHVGSEDAVARMRREIEVAQKLANHPRVMPVLDAGADATWMVMPLAARSAEHRLDMLKANSHRLRQLVEGVGAALAAAHELGWVHRDVKPANVLSLDRKWVLADWGLGRRPRGMTTVPGRTMVGRSFGTDGFAAPELEVDAHQAGPPADIYSLGQVIGWAVTGAMPRRNVPLVPPPGPWRFVVREATRDDPRARPQTIDEFLHLVADELDEPDATTATKADEIFARIESGEESAVPELWDLAFRHPDDYELYIDILPKLGREQVGKIVRDDPAKARDIVTAFRRHLGGGGWEHRPYKWADHVILLLFWVTAAAAEDAAWDLLDDAADTLFAWDARWDQYKPQDSIRPWLRRLDGEAARIVASVLRRYPESVAHFAGIADRRSDPRLAGLLGRQSS